MITQLNNYLFKKDEPLYNYENLEKVKQYIKYGKIPNDLNDIQLKRFVDRFKYGYTLKNNNIYYKNGLQSCARESEPENGLKKAVVDGFFNHS